MRMDDQALIALDRVGVILHRLPNPFAGAIFALAGFSLLLLALPRFGSKNQFNRDEKGDVEHPVNGVSQPPVTTAPKLDVENRRQRVTNKPERICPRNKLAPNNPRRENLVRDDQRENQREKLMRGNPYETR